MTPLAALLMLTAAPVPESKPLPAQQPELELCKPIQEWQRLLREGPGEYPQNTMRTIGGATVMLLGNADTGSWTMLQLRPQGTACAVDAGPGFELIGQGT